MIYVDKYFNISNCLICTNQTIAYCECKNLEIYLEDIKINTEEKKSLLFKIRNKQEKKFLLTYLHDYTNEHKNLLLKIKNRFPGCQNYKLYPYIKESIPFIYER